MSRDIVKHKLCLIHGGCRTDLAATAMCRAMSATGLDQAELAALVGVSTRTLRRWRHGEGLEALRAYLALCEAANTGRKAA